MDTNLRQDFMAIILVEAFNFDEESADALVTGKRKPAGVSVSRAMDIADTIVNRIDARCSAINRA